MLTWKDICNTLFCEKKKVEDQDVQSDPIFKMHMCIYICVCGVCACLCVYLEIQEVNKTYQTVVTSRSWVLDVGPALNFYFIYFCTTCFI